MSATELFLLRNQVSEELVNSKNIRPEDAAAIGRSLSADVLSLIAELGLEVAA